MKNLIFLIAITAFLFTSCGKDDPATSGSDEPVDLDCDTFFDAGDYSSVCFVAAQGLLADVSDNTGTTCVIELGLQPGGVNDYVTVAFFKSMILPSIPGLPSVTESVFLNIRNDSDNVENISNLGNDAFAATENDSDFSTRVQLYVRFSNVILTFDTVYENATGPHCANDHDELIKLAKIVLTNLA